MADCRGRLWQIALAGNVLVLLLGMLLLTNGGLLFGPPVVRSGEAPPSPAGPRAERVLLVVMDALRDDTAARAGLMPHFNALAERGGRGRTRVGALVPATVAAVQVLATGRVPPPAVFLEDFGARTADHGGLFQVLQQAGMASFFTGIHLWHDLYGPWLDGWETVETLQHDDPRVLAAGIRALQNARYELVVVHFAQLDEAAHRFGPHTADYAGAAAWYDQALGRLLEQAGPGTAVIVTADNGVSDPGGHAGPEPAVLTAPLATFGPGLPTGDLGTFPQGRIPELVLAALGLETDALPSGEKRHFDLWRLVPALAALGAALVLLGALAGGLQTGCQGFVLNTALWLGLGVALLLDPAPTLWLFALALSGAAAITPLPPLGRLWLPLLAGCGWAGLWLFDGWQALGSLTHTGRPLLWVLLLPLILVLLPGRNRPCWGGPWFWALPLILLAAAPALGGGWLVTAVALGLLLGLGLGRRLLDSTFDPRITGLLLAFCPALLAGLLGETVSLSTLDVSRAFRVVDSPLGLPGAVVVTVLRLALPGLALAVGLAPALAYSAPERAGALLAGLAAGLGGLGIVMALVLGLDINQTATALGLGGALRVLAAAVYLFPGLALAVAWAAFAERGKDRRTGETGPAGTVGPTKTR